MSSLKYMVLSHILLHHKKVAAFISTIVVRVHVRAGEPFLGHHACGGGGGRQCHDPWNKVILVLTAAHDHKSLHGEEGEWGVKL